MQVADEDGLKNLCHEGHEEGTVEDAQEAPRLHESGAGFRA